MADAHPPFNAEARPSVRPAPAAVPSPEDPSYEQAPAPGPSPTASTAGPGPAGPDQAAEKHPVPFAYFLSLLDALSKIDAKQSASSLTAAQKQRAKRAASSGAGKGKGKSAAEENKALRVVERWISLLPAGAGPGPEATEAGSGKAFFRLLFPHEDVARRYGLKETLLSRMLAQYYGLDGADKERVLHWDGRQPFKRAHKQRYGHSAGTGTKGGKGKAKDKEAQWRSGAQPARSGCLGIELELALAKYDPAAAVGSAHSAGTDAGPEGDADGDGAGRGKGKWKGLSIVEVDGLLTQLARFSKWSDRALFAGDEEQDDGPGASDGDGEEYNADDPDGRGARAQAWHSRMDVVSELLRGLCAREAKFVVQILLKDLAPVLYPLPTEDLLSANGGGLLTRAAASVSSSGAAPRGGLLNARKSTLSPQQALELLSARSFAELSTRAVMRAWHPLMPLAHAVRACLADTADAVEDVPRSGFVASGDELECLKVKVGTRIEIPKCLKGTSPAMAASVLGNRGVISAETKYDGERVQLHLSLPPDPSDPSASGAVELKIFAKSGRDSTWDRVDIHPIALAALGVDPAKAQNIAGRRTPDVPDVTVVDERLTERFAALPAQRFTQTQEQAQPGEGPSSTTAAAGQAKRQVRRDVVLECEMIAWDENEGHVAEFYKIKQIKASSANFNACWDFLKQPPRAADEARAPWLDASRAAKRLEPDEIKQQRLKEWHDKREKELERLRRDVEDDVSAGYRIEDKEAEARSRLAEMACFDETPETYVSEMTTIGEFHLALVFFDILHIDGETLLDQPYSERRRILESVIRSIPGFAQVVDTTMIDLGPGKTSRVPGAMEKWEAGLRDLHRAFAICHANRGEGLVLKSVDAPYVGGTQAHGSTTGHVFDADLVASSSWVKLKADYIPKLGDSLDLCIIGASWDKQRARELRVPTGTFIRFHLGAIRKRPGARKHAVHTWFTSKYGLTRKQLLDINHDLQCGLLDAISFKAWEEDPQQIRYSLRFEPDDVAPDVVFCQPLLAEVVGGGFQKNHGGHRYHLRWPRINKIYNSYDRDWTEGHELTTINVLAKECVRQIKEPAGFKDAYLERLKRLTYLDGLQWQRHAVKHPKLEITEEECVEPRDNLLLELNIKAEEKREKQVALLAGRPEVRKRRKLQESRSEPNMLHALEEMLSAGSKSAFNKLTAQPLQRELLRSISAGENLLAGGARSDPPQAGPSRAVSVRSLKRDASGRLQIEERQVKNDALFAVLAAEAQELTLRQGLRKQQGLQRVLLLQSDQSHSSRTSSSSRSTTSRAGPSTVARPIPPANPAQAAEHGDAPAVPAAIAPAPAQPVLALDTAMQVDHPQREPERDAIQPVQAAAGPKDGPDHLQDAKAHVEAAPSKAAPAEASAADAAARPRKCFMSPRLCESIAHLYAPHINSEDPIHGLASKHAEKLFDTVLPQNRTAVTLETLLLAIGGPLGLGPAHFLAAGPSPAGEDAPSTVEAPATALSRGRPSPPRWPSGPPRKHAVRRKAVPPFHARGIVFVDEARFARGSADARAEALALSERVVSACSSLPTPTDPAAAARASAELCTGAALHPQRSAIIGGASSLLLLDWRHIGYYFWLMEACESECGRWHEDEEHVEPSGPGCFCCRHFDALLPLAVSVHLPSGSSPSRAASKAIR